MRFLSTESARAGERKSGHAFWNNGCRDDCNFPILVELPNNELGHCYVKGKDKG